MRLCLHGRDGWAKIVESPDAPPIFQIPATTPTENGEYMVGRVTPQAHVFKRTDIRHGATVCYKYWHTVTKVPTPVLRPRKGCQYDDDGDGNCHLHPHGCFP